MTKYNDLPEDIKNVLQNLSSGELIDIGIMAAHACYADYGDCPLIMDRRWTPAPHKNKNCCSSCRRSPEACVGCWLLWLIDGLGRTND